MTTTLFRGTPNDDKLFGSKTGPSLMFGGKGNDDLRAGTGQTNDILFGGKGNDLLWGFAGNDILFGGKGNDMLSGSLGNDIGFGGKGDDNILLDSQVAGSAQGNDIGFGGKGNDHVDGGGGNDILFGGNGNDVLVGGKGNDFLSGGTGDDMYRLNVGDGKDIISESGGNDVIRFGASATTSNVVLLRRDNDLLISYVGSDDLVMVKNHFNGNGAVESLQLSNGNKFLSANDINTMVNSMSAYATSNGITLNSVDDVKNNAGLLAIVSSSWHN